jgi:hypothetical protein
MQGLGYKPYSVVRAKAVKESNGDFSITWVRRTRISGGWRDFVDVPLSETSEKYEVVIFDGSTEKMVINANIQSATYTSAQQVADFGSTQSNITFKVYQISGDVGRGG